MASAELDIEQNAQLLSYLQRQKLIALHEKPHFSTLSGGVSNRTVLVRLESGDEWVIKQALARLRVAVEWYSDPARIHREALALRVLEKLAPPGSITPFVYEDHVNHLLIMRAVAQPHDNWKSLLLNGHLETDHVRQFSLLLAQIHERSAQLKGELSALFADRTFFESLRLEPYYLYSAQRFPVVSEFIKALCADTRQNRCALVHGDYSPKNILIHQGKLVLLDHEVVHWGDPAFDVGFALTHLLSKAHHLTHLRNDFASAALLFWSLYHGLIAEESFGADFDGRVVRHTAACLLARVAGRSPLEYLDEQSRSVQLNVSLALINNLPTSVEGLISEFLKGIEADD